MECAFKQSLLKEKTSLFDMEGSCDLFESTVTSQGICHTFNGLKLSELWKPNIGTNSFEKAFPSNHRDEYFQGAGMAEGKNLVTYLSPKFIKNCSTGTHFTTF